MSLKCSDCGMVVHDDCCSILLNRFCAKSEQVVVTRPISALQFNSAAVSPQFGSLLVPLTHMSKIAPTLYDQKNGFLDIRGEKKLFDPHPSFHKRWFVLDYYKAKLVYYEGKNSDHIKKSISLVDLSFISATNVADDGQSGCFLSLKMKSPTDSSGPEVDSKKKLVPKSVKPTRTFLLRADTKEDRDGWLKALEASLHQVTHFSTRVHFLT